MDDITIPPGAAGEQGIANLGARVRALRKTQRLTRRDLAGQTGISERYLADIETGKANISLALLARVATALETSIASLLSRPGEQTVSDASLRALIQTMSPARQREAYRLLVERLGHNGQIKGVALVGLRGAGKTTLGNRLALALDVPFIRLSRQVEELTGLALGELMELSGERAYRRYEKMGLDVISAGAGKVVLEAGGGVIYEPESFSTLLEHYKVIWLKASPDEHMNRVIEQGDMRPMAGHAEAMEGLRDILREREADYRRAHYTLDTEGRSEDDCFNELMEVSSGVFAPASGA